MTQKKIYVYKNYSSSLLSLLLSLTTVFRTFQAMKVAEKKRYVFEILKYFFYGMYVNYEKI